MNRQKNGSTIFALIALFLLFTLVSSCSKSDEDTTMSNSGCPGKKTWDEMTSKERKACEKYFESKFESGEWKFNN
mgnify:CR=1 FL=1